jgi:hypothetical protein
VEATDKMDITFMDDLEASLLDKPAEKLAAPTPNPNVPPSSNLDTKKVSCSEPK